MADDRRPVVVYRERLGLPSEPFITAQGEGLQRHRAHYLAIRRPGDHPPPADRVVPWTHDPLAEGRRYVWKRWGVAPRTTRALRALAPVLVHAHFGRDAVQVLPFVERAKVPLVVTFHGHDATRSDADLRAGSYSDRLFLDRRPRLASTAARVLPVSAFLGDQLRDRGFPQERIAVHYIGVDTAAIAERAAQASRQPDQIVFVGRLEEQKGLADLIDAVGVVAATRPTVKLTVLGDGSLRETFVEQAARLRVDAEFLGAATPHDVWTWMGRAAVVVVPSRLTDDGRAEGFGLVAAEAEAAGAPVVATATGGLPEAVAPAMQDLLVPQRDPTALAAAIERVLDDPRRADAAAREARTWIAEHRDLTRQNRRLEELYEAVAPR